MQDDARGAQQITVNQIIGYNLRRARLFRGWTQTQATEELSRYLGVKWSKQSYSAAERSGWSVTGVKEFRAGELVAFAAAFEVTISWFFAPLPGTDLVYVRQPDDYAVGAVEGRTEHRAIWLDRDGSLEGEEYGRLLGSTDPAMVASKLHSLASEIESFAPIRIYEDQLGESKALEEGASTPTTEPRLEKRTQGRGRRGRGSRT